MIYQGGMFWNSLKGNIIQFFLNGYEVHLMSEFAQWVNTNFLRYVTWVLKNFRPRSEPEEWNQLSHKEMGSVDLCFKLWCGLVAVNHHYCSLSSSVSCGNSLNAVSVIISIQKDECNFRPHHWLHIVGQIASTMFSACKMETVFSIASLVF